MQPFSTEATYPALCLEVGLDCETCVRETATEAAKVCPGLKGKAIGQLFVLLYPNAACASAHHLFAHQYQSAPAELGEKPVPRKPAGSAKSKTRVAVA
jgi:hypothetical protein